MAKHFVGATFSLLACVLVSACSDDGSTPRDADPSEPGEMSEDGDTPADNEGGETGDENPNNPLGEPYPPSDRTVRPSSGCDAANAAPPVGARTLQTGNATGNYIVTRPATYDPTHPYPLAFVFHGANNTDSTCRGGGNCGGVAQALEGESVVIYMRSFGTSWTGPERDQNVTYFDDLLAHAKATYCVDERKVYALGTSSGAHFSNILGCRRGDDLLAIVPGAGERLETTGCVGRVAALVIHGVDDTSVPFAFGEQARDFYAAQNGCTTETVPVLSSMHAGIRTARDAQMSAHGCVDFQGCMDGLPVRWCEHSEPGYDGSTHGWPGFGGTEAWDFVRDL